MLRKTATLSLFSLLFLVPALAAWSAGPGFPSAGLDQAQSSGPAQSSGRAQSARVEAPEAVVADEALQGGLERGTRRSQPGPTPTPEVTPTPDVEEEVEEVTGLATTGVSLLAPLVTGFAILGLGASAVLASRRSSNGKRA